MVTENSQKVAKNFYCESCDYSCIKKGDYNKHLSTRKHEKKATSNTLVTNGNIENSKVANPLVFSCKNCNKVYKSRKGLWGHQKKCDNQKCITNVETNVDTKNENEVIYKLIEQNMDLVSQNQEFKQMMIEQNKQNVELQKQLLDLAKESKITNINNTNNNKFNMNFFLNEKCKDALNIMDFVNSLQLQMQDLEETGRLGYVQGISRIFINGLKQLDVYKRPIHCSDVKRETLYIKDNDSWEKEDDGKKKITRAIRHISIRNAKQINEWTKENKGYNDSSSKKSDKYLKLVSEANGGEPEELNKIIKNISTNVIINKENV
jgi:hypothetical protein